MNQVRMTFRKRRSDAQPDPAGQWAHDAREALARARDAPNRPDARLAAALDGLLQSEVPDASAALALYVDLVEARAAQFGLGAQYEREVEFLRDADARLAGVAQRPEAAIAVAFFMFRRGLVLLRLDRPDEARPEASRLSTFLIASRTEGDLIMSARFFTDLGLAFLRWRLPFELQALRDVEGRLAGVESGPGRRLAARVIFLEICTLYLSGRGEEMGERIEALARSGEPGRQSMLEILPSQPDDVWRALVRTLLIPILDQLGLVQEIREQGELIDAELARSEAAGAAGAAGVRDLIRDQLRHQ